MGAALGGVDVVGEGVNVFVVAVVVLHGDFHRYAVFQPFHVNGFGEQHFLVLVQVFYEFPDATLVVEGTLQGFLGPLVPQNDLHALVQEGHFPDAGFQHVKGKINAGVEHALRILGGADVRPEAHGGARFRGFADHTQVVFDLAHVVFLLVNFSVLAHLHPQVAGKGVHHARAHAVQAAGDLITLAPELAARVQHGQANFHGGAAHLGMDAHGEAAPVVLDGN